MEDLDESSSTSRPKPSTIPSWVTLGFILGALFVWALPRSKEPLTPAPPPEFRSPPTSVVATPPRQSDVEALFSKWGPRYALWADDVTYVCMYDQASGTFRDCFEVVRRGDTLYFRTVERPGNLRARDDVPVDSPLEFLNPIPVPRSQRFDRLAPPPTPARTEPQMILPSSPPSSEKIPIEINPPKP